MNHFISANDMSNEALLNVFKMAEQFRENPFKLKKQVFAANLFFEPSTRTKTSFMMAEKRLGMETIDFCPETSSIQKGESLYDTVKTFEAIGADFLVIRHEADDWIRELNNGISIPIINAGAGKKEHPTQSLLDAITIYQEFGTFKGLNIVIAGDIKHSRVAHSNAQLLQRLGANVYQTGAPHFVDESLDIPFVSMDEAVKMVDCLMLLRIQHERHDGTIMDIGHYHEQYGLTLAREKMMKKHAILLHPAPVNRGVEIDASLVECARSRIFKQMENGVYIRMAVLIRQLIKWGIIDENEINQCETGKGKRIPSLYCAN